MKLQDVSISPYCAALYVSSVDSTMEIYGKDSIFVMPQQNHHFDHVR